MIAIYCRQSVDKKDSISIEQQVEYCKARINGEAFEVYKDKGFTGANTKRPDFERLMKDVSHDRVSKIIVYKVDRISRSLQDFVNIYSEFEKHNVSFESCSEQFDTSNAMGKATLQIIMVFAELERNMIQKRVKDNFYERAKKGLFPAGVAPFGFNKVETVIDGINTHMLEADSEKSKTVEWLYNEYLSCKSIGNLVKQLNARGYKTNRGNDFSGTSVRRILRNPVYVRADADVYRYLQSKGAIMNQPIDDYIGVYGCTVYGERKKKTISKFTSFDEEYIQLNLHEGVIDSRTWLAVQYELDKNKPISNSGKGTHTWLTGLTKCGYCGLGVSVVNGQRNGKRYVNCGGRKNKFCYERTAPITFDDVESAVEEDLLLHLKNYEYTKVRRSEESERKHNEIIIRLAKIDDEIQSLVQRIPQANEAVMKYINQSVEQLEQQRRELEVSAAEASLSEFEDISPDMIRQALDGWSDFSFEQKKVMAQAFIDKIEIWNDRIDIQYKIRDN